MNKRTNKPTKKSLSHIHFCILSKCKKFTHAHYHDCRIISNGIPAALSVCKCTKHKTRYTKSCASLSLSASFRVNSLYFIYIYSIAVEHIPFLFTFSISIFLLFMQNIYNTLKFQWYTKKCIQNNHQILQICSTFSRFCIIRQIL